MIKHSSPISGVAAYDGKLVATAGYDNQVILWDARSRLPLARAQHDHLANQVAFSPDGRHLLTSSSDYTARLWNLPDLKLKTVFSDYEDDVEMSVFHPTDELVATASRDHRVRVHDFRGTLVHCFTGHRADVISVAWTESGRELVTSSDDGTIKRWSLDTGGLVADIDLGGVETDTVALSASGTIFAGNDEGEIIVITDSGRTVHRAHDAGIKRLVYNASGHSLVSLSYDRTLRVWQVENGFTQVAAAALPSEVWPRSCAFLDEATLVFATFGSSYAMYHVDEDRWSLDGIEPTHGVNAVILHQGRVVTVGDAGIVRADGAEIQDVGSLCNFLARSGDRVVTGGQMGILFDALTGERLYQHRSPLNCAAAFVRDGRPHVVVGAYTGEGLVFSEHPREGFRLEATVPLHANAVKDVAVAGEEIFSVCADTGASWFRTEDFTETRRLRSAHDKIANGCVAVAPGVFASISRDLKLRIWTGGAVDVIDTPHDHSIKCVAASADGRRIGTGSYYGLVAVYDRDTGTWPIVERPTASGISSIHYDPDASRWLAGSYDGAVYPVGHGSR